MLLKLLGAPIGVPLGGFKFILEQLRDMAERELYSEERIREDLLLLQLRLQDGEISEEEFVAQEAAIIERLRVARELRQARASESDTRVAGDDPFSGRGAWTAETWDDGADDVIGADDYDRPN